MPRPLKVLIVEDNPADAELALRQLRRDGFEPEWERVDTEDAYLARLQVGLDLILSDYDMPLFSGLRALELLKTSGLDVPFVLVSGTIGEDIAVIAMKKGASDYLLKDRLARLGQSIDHLLNERRLQRERRQAGEALRLFRALLDQSNDSIEVLDPETARFIDVNEKGFTCLGYSRAEFLSLRLFDIELGLKMQAWPQLLAKIRTTGSVRGEGIHQRKDGTTFPVEFSVKLVKLDRDYLLAVVRDISERKEMEAKFFRAQRLEAIGSLASGIAHDMNNILAPIMMSAPLLRMGLSVEQTEKTLVTIETSAQRGADLVRQLLTFGRGVEGARRIVRLGAMLDEVARIAQRTFPKNISIARDDSEMAWPVMGDSTQLHQVLLNLCVNARDAMPQGGVLTIAVDNVRFDESLVSMTPGAKVGPYVQLSVTDTGTGIPPDVVDKIFDPFFTTKEPGKGTGLGLSTVIGIVKSHGGFVSVLTKMGVGTTFQVYFPAMPEGQEAALAKGPGAAPAGHGELILVVDDEEKIREVVRDMLVKYGYQVIVANDGADATKQFVLHAKEIRAVITDLEMPVMDGMELVHVLRTLNPALAVLVSSGIASEQALESRRAGLKALGISTILDKPYTAEKILHAVHDQLTSKQVRHKRPGTRNPFTG
jgi:PAS domain S-box-containing protein